MRSHLATTLVWIMAMLAVVNAAQRVASGAGPDAPTMIGTGAILYLGYSCLKSRQVERTV